MTSSFRIDLTDNGDYLHLAGVKVKVTVDELRDMHRQLSLRLIALGEHPEVPKRWGLNRLPVEAGLPDALVYDSAVPYPARLLYMVLWRELPHATGRLSTEIRPKKIARVLGVTRPAIMKWLRELRDHGWIIMKKGADGRCRGGYLKVTLHERKRLAENGEPAEQR